MPLLLYSPISLRKVQLVHFAMRMPSLDGGREIREFPPEAGTSSFLPSLPLYSTPSTSYSTNLPFAKCSFALCDENARPLRWSRISRVPTGGRHLAGCTCIVLCFCCCVCVLPLVYVAWSSSMVVPRAARTAWLILPTVRCRRFK